jgi:hypothetical protein
MGGGGRNGLRSAVDAAAAVDVCWEASLGLGVAITVDLSEANTMLAMAEEEDELLRVTRAAGGTATD